MRPKTVVDANLQRAGARWRRLRLLQHISTLGVAVCAILMLVAWALVRGWDVPPWFVRLSFVGLGLATLVAWGGIALAVSRNTPGRPLLAARLERDHAPLQDRLNTVVHLEKPARRDATVRSFYQRILQQTHAILARSTPETNLSTARPMAHFWVLLLVIVATIWVYDHYSPWKQYMAAYRERLHAKMEPPPNPDPVVELALPTNNVAEQKQPWGEVRITEPARDLAVTKVDVVPLQIEAAATDPLEKVAWTSTINGRSELTNNLPAPAEPRFAVYKPLVYLDEMRLTDWDVITYYARANTDKLNAFASEVYFLEVRPFREDILKMPGGEDGQAYQCLNELTALISQQQHIIRQTHQHVQNPPPQPQLEAQDRLKLAEAEGDLGQSVNHLYAKMATEMENKPIGEALDQLAKAENELGQATGALKKNTFPEAQNRERSALAELVAARKMFQKAVSENPSAFEEPKEEPEQATAQDQTALQEIAEYRNQAKAAQDLLDKTLQKERDIAEKARTQSRTNYTRLAAEQKQLQNALEQFCQQNPSAFRDAEPQLESAKEKMSKTAEALAKRNSSARTNAQDAVKSLEQLQSALQQKSADQQLADAHKLKQMLDRQIQTMQQCQNAAEGLPAETMQSTASQAKQTLQELKKAAENQPTRDAFSPELRNALGQTNIANANSKLTQLQQAPETEQRKQAAGEAAKELAKVSDAFDKSLPDALRMAQKSDSLKPGADEGLELGLGQLESLIKQLEKQKQGQDQAKQGREALFNLQTGMREQYGSNERGNQILVRLEHALKQNQPPDVGNLKKLMDELQRFSVEMKSDVAKKEEKTEVTNIDPSRLPPAYRGRIQKYFEKLSEK
ncbi:MAG: hypothetical protein L0Y58_09280 [Verrucomicrobia subdivision 3 bacterium]|nr:hypothetical protein [Limisphaerales bacterium]